ncbi:MAG: sulfotransferase [Arenicellales bacterium]
MQQHPPTPSWNHPLFGADVPTLIRALVSSGGLPAGVWPLAGALLLSGLLRTPISWVERTRVAATLRGAPRPRAPVFIVGHWRSGTTHLFNLMSRDPRFAWAGPFQAGMPWDFLLLGRVLRPLIRHALPRHRFIDAVPVRPDSPQEDEIALASMQNLSYYHGIYFPRRFALRFRQGIFLEGVAPREIARWRRRFEHYNRKCLLGHSDGTLLVKNPVYTGRVAEIRRVWPDARFVHIHRNPYEVFESTRKFYRALLPRFALQAFDDETVEDLILEAYPRMVDKLYKDARKLEPGRFAELRFEDLERDPLVQLEQVYGALAIPGFAGVGRRFREYLDSISDYRKNTHVLSDDVVARVDRHWGGLVRRWGYGRPRTQS